MTDSITPFKIAIGDAQLDDLKRRLLSTRWPDKETPGGWSQGIPLQYMQDVVAYWAETYDWRAREASLNRFEQFRTTIDGLGIHFIHHRSPHPGALPLLMTHGWPGSIVEFQKVIGALADPTTYGGSASDAFHVVCPSLPGFAFSDKPAAPGWNVERIGRAWGVLMRRLGYTKYFAQGGDWGAIITTAIGLNDTANCLAIHLNMPLVMPDPQTMGDLTDQEKSALAGLQHYTDVDSAYAKQQATRPQTLGFGLADSPSGQAAWILEKFWAWTDCNGHPENVLSRDEMLDNVMLYWLTNSGASSARIYWESMHAVNRDPVMIPTGISMFPKEIFRCSKRWAEKRFQNLVYWNELGKGGHFAALEQPALFIDEVRNCFRLMR